MMYLSHIKSDKYMLRDDLIHHLLKRQAQSASTSGSSNGLITFSIVLGVITVLSIISGLIAYIFRRRHYFRRKKNLHISHIANTSDEEYNNALDYYTNVYYDDVKDNKSNGEKQSVSMHNYIPDAPGSDITGVDTVRSKNSNRNYRIVETKNDDSTSDVMNTTNKSDVIENDDGMSDFINNIDISSNATDFINKRESAGDKSDYSIIANESDMAPNRSNTLTSVNYRESMKSNNSVKSKKILHSNKQISQPTITSSSIYNQERANALASNLSRSATFNITRPAPPPPVAAHVKPPNEIKKLNSFESLIPSTFYYRQNSANTNNSNIDPTLRKDNRNNDYNPNSPSTNYIDLNRESNNNLSNMFVRHLYGDYV